MRNPVTGKWGPGPRPSLRLPIADRLMAHRLISPGPLATDCWLWTGTTDRDGYGKIRVKDHMRLVHRIAYAEFVGPLPIDKPEVNHGCDVRRCWRPNHLHPGTVQSNTAERDQRGRQSVLKGNDLPHARLTPAGVMALREEYARGGVRQEELAARFGISPSAVSLVIRRRNWKHVG